MIKSFKKLSIFIFLVIALMCLASCGNKEAKATFSIANGIEQDGIYTLYVPSTTESLDLSNYVVIPEDSEFEVFTSPKLKNKYKIESVVSLQTGENIFYIEVKDGMTKKDYTVKIIKKNVLSVTFNTNGGSLCETVIVDEGSVMDAPVTERVGYDFAGWDYDFANPVTTSITVNAQWTPKKFLIKSNDLTSDIEVTFDSQYSVPQPSKIGYNFIKWVTEDGKDFSASGAWKTEQDITINAVFEKQIYKITYVLGSGYDNLVKDYTVEDSVVHDAPSIVIDGLTFCGWYYEDFTTPVQDITPGATGDKTFYAKWVADEEIPHIIRIDADGMDFDGQEFTFYYGGMYELPTVPVREGYTYTWKIGEIKISNIGTWGIKSGATVFLEWIPETYNITYVFDSSTTNTNTKNDFTVESDTIILLDPIRPNATFVGWFTDPSLAYEFRITEIPTGKIGDVTLYAKFEYIKHTVNYDSNGGTVSVSSEQYEIGESFAPPTPRYPGYEFLGWYRDINNESSKLDMETWSYAEENITVFAKWKAIVYKINFIDNGNTTVKEYTVNDTVTAPILTSTTAAFQGWQAENSSKVYSNLVIPKGTIGDKTYIAKWSRLTYSYDANTKTATVNKYIRSTVSSTVTIPETVNYDGVDYTVTGIGANVFENMGSYLLTYTDKFVVEIPKTLKTIGANAFKNCTDVHIYLVVDDNDTVDTNAFADALVVADGNDHVVDVIKGRRPAIGWSIYA